MSNKIKYILFSIILGFLFIHIFQQITDSVYVRGLKGDIILKEKPVFSWNSWYSEEYQKKTEGYLNEQFGFRNWYVRLNNQYKYWMFNNAMAKGVVVGKSGELYEKGYIMTYYGHDYLGYYTILNRCTKLRLIQDTLSKLNTNFVIVMAPGKASYYPEFIPDWIQKKSDSTNYKTYAKLFNFFGINHIDFNKHFLELKDTIPYRLFSKAGVHWSTYGEYYAFDSIMHYLEIKTNQDLPEIDISEVEMSRKPKYSDADIGNGMNLIFPIDKDEYAYPKLKIDQENKTKLNAIVISDSFYWGVYGRGISEKLFKNNQFWYYYLKFIHAKEKKTKQQVNIKMEIEKTDVLMLMGSEHNIKDLSYGFIWDAFNIYYPNFSVDNYIIDKFTQDYSSSLKDSLIETIEKNGEFDNRTIINQIADSILLNDVSILKQISVFRGKFENNFRVQSTIEEIWRNEKWLNRIKVMAFKKHIPLNEMIYQNAVFSTNEKILKAQYEELKQTEFRQDSIEEIIKEIKSNKKWFLRISEKVKSENMDLQETLRKEAEWLYEYRLQEQKNK